MKQVYLSRSYKKISFTEQLRKTASIYLSNKSWRLSEYLDTKYHNSLYSGMSLIWSLYHCSKTFKEISFKNAIKKYIYIHIYIQNDVLHFWLIVFSGQVKWSSFSAVSVKSLTLQYPKEIKSIIIDTIPLHQML